MTSVERSGPRPLGLASRVAGQVRALVAARSADVLRAAPIQGEVAPGFEPVAEAFRANFVERGEIGASVCVFYRGEKVVDLWGGWADREARRPWERDTVDAVVDGYGYQDRKNRYRI